ncbi:flagellar type III secretion system protein FlhB [Paracoccus shanxieyensis]|uniref:Flagellar type III secretion system protein FlhB n=1 Tax=Paracoccus shanxieyensis TaxID=2675752 RepID=A0A6L6J3K8_9RHOB|nr:flagellar type III secretion system protein FlhB [Paracoccus shanxieyensis]MTH65850.1 flagellar type III secretion system protein FlhB [Paracoccus shanxieyensis]MTH89108.1 flagellar type III secretion system protein FlhB [Paracoccus shanxieyensis]
MSEQDEDRQYEASEQKLRRAREEGDIPRSTELGAALMYLGVWLAFLLAGARLVPDWLDMAARALGAERWPDGRGQSIMDLSRGIAGYAGGAVLAFVAIICVPIMLGLVVQRSVVFTPKKLLPDLKRIDPMKNAAQKFGKSGLVTFAISVAKVILVGIGGWLLYASLLGWMMTSEAMADLQWVSGLGTILHQALWLALGIGIAFAAIDMLWKRLEYMRRQRMSRKELQDEHKDSEGDPHMKSARRQKSVDIVLNSMLADVEKADVVIVNPTHYAVALEWKRGSGRAPVCLAKGVDEIAARIRERAQEHQIPLWSDPPCARAIHATVEIGAEIRSEHFAPVAAAIRFAEAMRKKAKSGWGGFPLPKSKGGS